LRSGGPYPLLAVSGEQGSAKTVLSKLLRALVDPNVAAVRALPREERELLTLGPIREEQRRSETEMWREFELARPAILGALLDAAAYGLKATGSVHLDRLPRMADFALWATACETGLWPAGTFTRAYTANRKAAIEGIIDADPIAACVREFMSERNSWTEASTFPSVVKVDPAPE
jgi:hypothetical protein